MTVEWEQQPLTRTVARSIRSGTRSTRPYLDGHRFDYSDLNEIWATPDHRHVVLNHGKDLTWQYWRLSSTDAWQLLDTADTRKEAQSLVQVEVAAEQHCDPGTYVVATKDKRTLRVHCASQEGPDALSSIFRRMGYTVALETVT